LICLPRYGLLGASKNAPLLTSFSAFPYELRDRQTGTLDSRYGDWECRSALARTFRRRRPPDELAVIEPIIAPVHYDDMGLNAIWIANDFNKLEFYRLLVSNKWPIYRDDAWVRHGRNK
jgi:hypothetical protein